MVLFKKSTIIGVSVTPEVGLEVAQIDFATQTLLKYGCKKLDFDINRRAIADLDLFKETLQDLLAELQIPPKSELVLNLPTVAFRVSDYAAAYDDEQIRNSAEDELLDLPFFTNEEPVFDCAIVPSMSVQFKKVAYSAVYKQSVIEIAMAIKDIGYKIRAIDSSVSAVLKALVYKQRIDIAEHQNWVLMLVDQMCCRIFNMQGTAYLDCYEEKISIGQVLDDAENYASVVQAANPILKNMPSKYLFVVSQTNVVSAEALASKLTYAAPIIYQEDNNFSNEALLEVAPDIDPSVASSLSLSIIGTAIYEDFIPYIDANFNLYNDSLGTIYTMEQPPVLKINGKKIILTNEFLIKLLFVVGLMIIVPVIIAFTAFQTMAVGSRAELENTERQIFQMQKFLKDNEKVSSDLFDEGDEIKLGLVRNKDIYSFLTIVGTEIPKKLWLTHLKLGDKVTIDGQSDNLESVYAFFRSIKDYVPTSGIKLQKLGLASNSHAAPEKDITVLDDQGEEDITSTEEIMTTLNADFYEFSISNDLASRNKNASNNAKKRTNNGNRGMSQSPDMELIN